MLGNLARVQIFCYGLVICLLGCSSCYHPPYNNFRPDYRATRRAAAGVPIGAAAGALTSGTVTGALIGGVAGGLLGGIIGHYQDSKPKLVKSLSKRDIQFVEYGDRMTLVVPTDKYFMFNSPRLNEICYPGLADIIKLLRLYPQSPVYVAGFTDNVGSNRHKKLLSQAQAETMLTFLWANNVQAYRLKAEGYGDKNNIAENAWIHGSAQNRRIEIQWFTGIVAQEQIIYVK